MSIVYLARGDGYEYHLRKEMARAFAGCEKVAIKLHMGEPGNPHTLKPADLEPVVGILKMLGVEPFFFDSPVAYPSPRRTEEGYMKVAEEMGWNSVAPVRVSNEVVVVAGRFLEYGVCCDLVEADGVLVVSHVKGHDCSGMGGAIKNLGMGALSRETKEEIHHGGEPLFTGQCIQCRACENACPIGAITVDEYPIVEGCYGCSNCTYVCPLGSMKPIVAHFDILLAEGATTAHKSFKKSYYLSFVKNITKRCDCDVDPGPIIGEDIGVVYGEDGVALDAAAVDLVRMKMWDNVFVKYNKKDPMRHIKAAEDLGMGSTDYEIIEVPNKTQRA